MYLVLIYIELLDLNDSSLIFSWTACNFPVRVMTVLERQVVAAIGQAHP